MESHLVITVVEHPGRDSKDVKGKIRSYKSTIYRVSWLKYGDDLHTALQLVRVHIYCFYYRSVHFPLNIIPGNNHVNFDDGLKTRRNVALCYGQQLLLVVPVHRR